MVYARYSCIKFESLPCQVLVPGSLETRSKPMVSVNLFILFVGTYVRVSWPIISNTPWYGQLLNSHQIIK